MVVVGEVPATRCGCGCGLLGRVTVTVEVVTATVCVEPQPATRAAVPAAANALRPIILSLPSVLLVMIYATRGCFRPHTAVISR